MATKLYVGINGSGKSYEVTTVVILNALRSGRRVVSNISGLNYEAMREILEGEGLDSNSIGTIFHVENAVVLQENFFRSDEDPPEFETVLQAGDLLVLDEIWRFWPEGKKVTERQLNFVRMHRHYVHAVSGLTCEIVIITQLVTDVPRNIRGVVEQTFRMTKHTALGSTTRYRVDIFSGASFTKSTPPIQSLQRSYNPDLFKLYSSHSMNAGGKEAKEQSIDKRGNLLSSNSIKYGIPLAICFIFGLIWFFNKMFHSSSINGSSAKPAALVSGSAVVAPSSSVMASMAAASAVAAAKQFDISDDYKVLGNYRVNGNIVFVLKRSSNSSLRYIQSKEVNGLGSGVEIKMPNGSTVSTFSGFPERQGQGQGMGAIR